LSFDGDAAGVCAEIGASRRAAGRPISQFDATIAAITRSRGAGLAAHNAKNFQGCGIEVVNPWESTPFG
jgi:toxin FitB